jgi:NAD dependent epimerase/dehydratase family enzyme
MRVFITGASGFLGSALMPGLRAAGHQPLAVVRRLPQADELQWDPYCPLDPSKLATADAVVHLAGKNVAGRWTAKSKQEMLESRAHGTQTLAMAAAESYRRTGKPRVFVAASGMSYYGDRGDELLTEDSPSGTGFLTEVVRQWEAVTSPAGAAGLRVVCLRIGIVLGRGGGALKPMLVAPAPVRNAEFVRALGRELHRPTIFPLPAFAVRAALGEMGEELLLTSARVVPARLTAAGYVFRHSDLRGALHAALG